MEQKETKYLYYIYTIINILINYIIDTYILINRKEKSYASILSILGAYTLLVQIKGTLCNTRNRNKGRLFNYVILNITRSK